MPANSSQPYTFDRVVRILAGAALLAGAVWLIGILRNVLLPFCLACLIAYLLEPIVELNSRLTRIKKRAIPVLLTLLETTLFIGLILYFIVPSVIKEVHQMGEMLHSSPDSSATVPLIPENIIVSIKKWMASLDFDDLLTNSRLASLLNSGTSFVASAIDFLFHTLEWLLTFIYVIFVLIDYPRLMQGFRHLIPVRYRTTVRRVGNDVKTNMNSYFRGQALIASCAAIFYCIGFSIVGIPMAIVLGVTVGILYMIPYFQYITLIPVALVCIIDSISGNSEFWPEFGRCLLVYAVSQCICDYLLTPKIMGKAMGLNPAIILLSLSVWGTLLGIIGMIIALPLTTMLLAYYREYIIKEDPTE